MKKEIEIMTIANSKRGRFVLSLISVLILSAFSALSFFLIDFFDQGRSLVRWCGGMMAVLFILTFKYPTLSLVPHSFLWTLGMRPRLLECLSYLDKEITLTKKHISELEEYGLEDFGTKKDLQTLREELHEFEEKLSFIRNKF